MTDLTRDSTRMQLDAVALVTRLLVTGRDAMMMVSPCRLDAIRLAHRFPSDTMEIRAVPRQVLRHAAHWKELAEVTHEAAASSDARVVGMLNATYYRYRQN